MDYCVWSFWGARHQTNWNLQFARKEEDYLQKLFSCTTRMLAPMSRPQQYRQFETWSSRFCHIHLTVLLSHRATFMRLVHLKRYYVVAGLAAIKTWNKRCIHGFRMILDPASPMESGSMWRDKKVFETAGKLCGRIVQLLYIFHFLCG
jgi:hypothetical protein